MSRSLVTATGRVSVALLLATAACGDGAGPSEPPAFTTDANSYTFAVVNGVPQLQIGYDFANESGQLAALQGCSGNLGAAWWLEKRVGGEWKAAYPAVCEPNPDAGVPISAGGSYSGAAVVKDGAAGGADPRISERPVAGTYRLRFGLFENVNLQTGVGVRVTDGRQYSNTFTIQD